MSSPTPSKVGSDLVKAPMGLANHLLLWAGARHARMPFVDPLGRVQHLRRSFPSSLSLISDFEHMVNMAGLECAVESLCEEELPDLVEVPTFQVAVGGRQ